MGRIAVVRNRDTTIVDASKLRAARGAIASKSNATALRTRINVEDIADTTRLARKLQEIQDSSNRALQATQSNPHSAPCVVRNVAIPVSSTTVVAHTLGRPMTGWWVCRLSGNLATLYEVRESDAGYPKGASPTTSLVITNLATTGTSLVDFCISGD